jgi:hypothetical protein
MSQYDPAVTLVVRRDLATTGELEVLDHAIREAEQIMPRHQLKVHGNCHRFIVASSNIAKAQSDLYDALMTWVLPVLHQEISVPYAIIKGQWGQRSLSFVEDYCILDRCGVWYVRNEGGD